MNSRTIRPGLLEITAGTGENRLALYLLHGERSLLVDSGLRDTPATTIFPALAAAGLPPSIDMLLISHADADHHGGNAGILARSPATTVLCHQLDRPRVTAKDCHMRERYTEAVSADDTPFTSELLAWLEANIGPDTPVHIALSGGETIWLGPERVWDVIHAPGHTAGHLALWNASERTLIMQDAVLGSGVPDAGGRIASPPPYFAVDAYVHTIERLRALNAERVLTAHFAPIEGQAGVEQFFSASAAFVNQLDNLTLELVRSAAEPLTLRQVCAAVDARIGPFALAIQWVPPVRAHLERHAAQGRLHELHGGSGPRTWAG